MNALVVLLSEQGPLLVLGATMLLLAGGMCVWLTRSPVHRQRLAELSVLGVLLWGLLVCLPLPRLLPEVVVWRSMPNVFVADASSGEEVGKSTAMAESKLVDPAAVDTAEILEEVVLAEHRFEADDNALLGESSIPIVADSAAAPVEQVALPSEEKPAVAEATTANKIVDAAQAVWTSDLAIRWLAVAYLCIAASSAAWLAAGYLLLWYVRRTAAEPPTWVQELLRSLVPAGCGRLPRVIVSRRCSRAVSWGAVRPVILLPESLCRQRDSQHRHSQQLRSVLLHELGHVMQRDAWGNLLFCLAFPLLYWHPLYWLLRGQARLAAELVADDWAAQHTGKQAYVEQLVALAGSSSSGSVRLLGATGVVSSPSQFYRRMEMLLKRETELETRPSTSWRWAAISGCGAVVVLASLLAGVRPSEATAQDQPTEEKKAEAELPANAIGTEPTVEKNSDGNELPTPKEDAARLPGKDANGALADQLKLLESQKQELMAEIKKLRSELDQRTPANAARFDLDVAIVKTQSEINTVTETIQSIKRVSKEKSGELAAAQLDVLKAQMAEQEVKRAELERQLKELRDRRDQWPSAPGKELSGNSFKRPKLFERRSDIESHLKRLNATKAAIAEAERELSAGKGEAKPEQEQQIERRIKSLQEEERSLTMQLDQYQHGQHGVPMLKEIPILGQLFSHDKQNLLIVRQETDGVAKIETWRTVDGGQRVMEERVQKFNAPIVKATIEEDERTGSFIVKYQLKGGESHVAVYQLRPAGDSTVVTEERRGNDPRRATQRGQSTQTSDDSLGIKVSRELDLINLATSYADAVAAVESGQAKVGEIERLIGSNAVSKSELTTAQAALKSAMRKENLLRRITQVALQSTKQEYSRVRRLAETGVVPTDSGFEAEAKLRILEEILSTRPNEADHKPEPAKDPKPIAR